MSKKISKEKINLLPEHLRSDPPLTIDHLLVLLLILSFALEITLGVKQAKRQKKINSELTQLKGQLSKIDREISNYNVLETKIKEKEKSENYIKMVLSKKIQWSSYFKELSLLLPKDVWLTYFKATKGEKQLEIKIKGRSSSQAQVAKFYEVLVNSHRYKKILINYSEILDSFSPTLYQFTFATQEQSATTKKAAP